MIFKKLSGHKGGARAFLSQYKNRPWMMAATILATVLENLFIPALYLGGAHMRQTSLGLTGSFLVVKMQIFHIVII